jgi:1,2-phenylacetyl-CoA epoxidase catalytic subunit
MSTPIDYLLHLADNAVVLGQRNAEWCGHGPILEEDLALANVSLDLIGQARLLYQRVAELKGGDASEDSWPTSATPTSFATTRCWSCRTTARWWATPRPTGTTPPPSCATSCTPR